MGKRVKYAYFFFKIGKNESVGINVRIVYIATHYFNKIFNFRHCHLESLLLMGSNNTDSNLHA